MKANYFHVHDEAANEPIPATNALYGVLLELGDFVGTATELKAGLDRLVDPHIRDSWGWPKAANSLSLALRRLIPNLRKAGIEVEMGIRQGRAGKRMIQ